MSELRGYISRQYTVWCGECGHWKKVDSALKKRAEYISRKAGWKNTSANGWTCPKCLEKKA
jgi:hypothetical protein